MFSEVPITGSGGRMESWKGITMMPSCSCARPGPVKWVLLFILILLPGTTRAGELYFMIVFASQREPYRPRLTHSFATFIKATGEGSCPGSYQLESHTISWLPTTMEVNVHRLFPECGRNLDLEPTLRWACSHGQRISMWGPFQIQKELYDLAMCQLRHLERGEVQYKAADTGYLAARVSNCTHAVSDLAGTAPLRIATPGYGNVASYVILRRLKRWIIEADCIHTWLNERLSLGCYPIVHKDLRAFGILQRLTLF
jgi:hypothetical protein